MKILQVVAALDGGGVESLLKNYLSYMTDEQINIDFITHGDEIGLLEPFFKSRGCNIYHIVPTSKNSRMHFRQINQIMHNGSYDLVQVHQGNLSWPILFYAWKNKIPIRIAHAHQAYRTKKNLKNKLYLILTKLLATHLWACGKEAGVNMWENDKFYVMNNAIELTNYSFDSKEREKIRQELGIGDEFVIGHVGRFTYQKNHEFIIKLASALKKADFNYKMILLGNGPDQERVLQLANKMGCVDKIIFTGVRNDVNKCLSAMDLFILPSNFEGLPVVMVEAQANGVPVIASDKITQEIKLLENVEYLPISDVSVWSQEILSRKLNRIDCNVSANILSIGGYDISRQAIVLQEQYKKMIK